MRTSSENTLEAFHRAKAEGVDGIECDVQLSADGEIFIFHDDNALRVCGRDVEIASLPWREIKELKVFGRFAIPHLNDVLSAMEGWPGAEIFFDIHQNSIPLAEALGRRLAAASIRPRAFALDFYSNRHLLKAAKAAAPTIRLAAMPGAPWNTIPSCRLGAESLSLGWDGRLNRALYRSACVFYDVRARVAEAKALGVESSGGLANDPAEIAYFLDQGMTGIWTDDLAMTRGVLESLKR